MNIFFKLEKYHKCKECQKNSLSKELKKIGKNSKGYFIHPNCLRTKRTKFRENLLRNVVGIRKRRSSEEVKKTRKESSPPIIKGSKFEKKRKSLIERQTRKGSWYIFGYLTKVEKQLLFRKYMKQGLSYELAGEKVKRDVQYLSQFVKNLRKENEDKKEDIDSRFKEEFAKLINQ